MKIQQRGFTLVELIIVVAIIGILSAIAYPSYSQYVIRSKRSDGMAALMGAVQAMERYRSNNYSYGAQGNPALSTVFATQVPVEGGDAYYNLTMVNTATTYTITATPTGSMPLADGLLTISNTGVRGWGARTCWPEGGNDC